MNLKTNIVFFLTIFILLTEVRSQQFIQICSEPESIGDCEFSSVVPDYKSEYYSYVIARDTFATDVIKFGKDVNDYSEIARTDLLLDIYLPCNNVQDRPLVLVPQAHGYTSEFGKVGLDNNGKYRYLLNELAERGYVAITYEYRVYTPTYNTGFYFDISPFENNGNTLDSCAVMAFVNGSSTDTNNFYRCYSCMVNAGEPEEADAFFRLLSYNHRQDIFAAINYALEDPQGLGLNIDVNNIFTAGLSNGGQIAMANAFIDASDFSDSVGSLITSLYGDFTSTSTFNHIPNDFEFKGVGGLWGSVHNLDWIDANDPSPFLIHGTWDEIVPYQSNYIGFGQYSDSSKFWTHGSEDVACKLINEQIDFGLISIKKGVHGYFRQDSPCLPDETCGFNVSDEVIKKLVNAFKFLRNGGDGGTYVRGFFPENINCQDFVQSEVPVNYLVGPDGNGNCVSDDFHVANNLNKLLSYCNCNNPSESSAVNSIQHSFKSIEKSTEFNLYPNPAEQFISIESSKDFTKGTIYDSSGKVVTVIKNDHYDNQFTVDISKLNSGIYTVLIDNETKRFIKMD